MATFDLHARERLIGRLADLRPEARVIIAERAMANAARRPTGRHAVRCYRDAAMHGTAWSDESNGTDVWAIIEDGHVRTLMFRRPTQPMTPDAFRVETVAFEE